ncbi:MAG: hypothetical protein KGL44_12625 [Sphingomonadales bacterium]|nr:hypothetical protein [Sphingomonadales bacterium]
MTIAGSSPVAPTLRASLARTHRWLVLFAVLLTGLSIVTSTTLILRDNAARNLALVARTVSYTVEPAVVFGDRVAVVDAVASVSQVNGVRRVEVFDNAGRRLADWSPVSDPFNARIEGVAGRLLRLPAKEDRVMRGRVVVGRVVLHASAAILVRYLLSGLLIVLGCMAAATVAVRWLARRSEARIFARIAEVADSARVLCAERRFDQRLPPCGFAELDGFSHDFNLLLAELDTGHRAAPVPPG